jgi:hypothetical protein
MKSTLCATLALLATATIMGAQTPQKTTPDSELVPNTRFQTMAERLDSGGLVYNYQDLTGLMESYAIIAKDMAAQFSPETDSKAIEDKVQKTVLTLGLASFVDYGRSSILRKDGRSQGKAFLRVDKFSGLLSTDAETAKPLRLTNSLPGYTAVALVSRWNATLIWDKAMEVGSIWVTADKMDEFRQGLEKNKEQTGVDVEAVVKSLGREAALALLLHPSETRILPLGKSKATIPRIGIVALAEVRNDTIFDLLRKSAEENKLAMKPSASDPKGWKILRYNVPFILQMWIKPVVASNGKVFVASLVDTDFEEILETPSSSPKLLSTPESKNLMAGLPSTYQSLLYISPRLTDTLTTVGAGALKNPMPSEAKVIVQQVIEQVGGARGYVSVDVYEKEGIFSHSRSRQTNPLAMAVSNSGSATVLLAAGGVATAIAVPAFQRARENSRGQACQENLSKIDGAKEQYALEFRLTNGTKVTMDDLVAKNGDGPGYLRETPRCPAGGTYSINAIGELPTCSIGTTNEPFGPHVLSSE